MLTRAFAYAWELETISLPHAPETVALHITIVVLRDGTIDLVGHINDQPLAEQILRDGMARLLQYHAGRIVVSVPGNGSQTKPEGIPC